ncbi:cobaltochelatase subunit CobN [Parathalassolituus penaei]|uniref:Cobaltochelatase subunit CobN n=1 Tax=Parathalassolituus penaei TaxID=2997323 RepID=A0A9X3EGI4_9GAMM|nr:cobaltochelatase subunit CobN [Parathalassolituus penaei]MCY0963886.1 cobaltochelatase subunit CobN [Parathalassolituus penaei]
MRFLILTLLLVLSPFSQATTAVDQYLLVLVSQRNAETIAEAAQQFQQDYPQLPVLARSDTQLRQLSTSQLQELISHSRAILVMGMYGPSVGPLQNALQTSQQPLLVFNSDHRLIQLSRLQGAPVFSSIEQVQALAQTNPDNDFDQWLADLKKQYPQQQVWIQGRAYWQAGGTDNTRQLLGWTYSHLQADVAVLAPKAVPRLQWLYQGQLSPTPPTLDSRRLLVIIDHADGAQAADAALLRALCQHAEQSANLNCLVALASWGEAGVEAVQQLQAYKTRLTSIVMLQDFVIGGGEGREVVTRQFEQLGVPVLKAIKLRDRSAIERQLSADGLAQDKVYYQVAMPELQGASQPLIVATAGASSVDTVTGINIQPIAPLQEGIYSVLERVQRWLTLQTRANRDKHIAIIYYNHPPGRHNIGADNLDVPASVWFILQQLKAAGYNTGELPESQQALLDLMQERGINLPRDSGALQTMSSQIQHMNTADYLQWFNTLSASIRSEMQYGPFGLLNEQIEAALQAGKPELASRVLANTMEEMRHLLEGVDHKGRERALALLDQLDQCYQQKLASLPNACPDGALKIIHALQQTGIEGLGGWGAAPGQVMTFNNELLLPGLTFGNVFIGPQPPRGWEVNEELLHANLAFPPPHQYLAFYHYLHDVFKADALVHLGRHSTYEFLPRRAVGLAEEDYSRIIAGDLPGIYPYIVDGVGEGIQAKRRGLAVMIDHLTPPLKSTELYDDLLTLRQLIESFEASRGTGNQAVATELVQQIRAKVEQLELKDELAESMSAELAIMGIGFDEVDDDMLVHEIGHYLTNLQEKFMPMGLHVFGKDWTPAAVDMMLGSMSNGSQTDQAPLWRERLQDSPKAELHALLTGLNGGYIAPGQGNDPIRSPDSLPTGRNFYALDGSLIPSQVAWQLGQTMASEARQRNQQSHQQNPDKTEAVVLWASDVVRDEGVMIAFGLDMLGIEPEWNSRGIVSGLKRQPLQENRVRRDVLFTTSGLFRDLYAQQMLWLNTATLLALDASADTIIRDYPALTLALQQALQPLGKQAQGGTESLDQNQVARHWVKQAQVLLAQGLAPEQAGISASLRVFGDAPASYGAGINRLVERSGAWEQRSELSDVYIRRLGHSFGANGFGEPAADTFKTLLAGVENTYLGRSSNLYGLIDNNDAFDYFGGLSMAVETITGQVPNNYVLDHSDPQQIHAQPLSLALRQELRGRFLNPQWLQGLMSHDYAGARTMGSEFIEYLWGWQVTNPTMVGDWAWEEVKAVYLDDRYQLGVNEFLERGNNAHVKNNMLAVMLVAIQKGFWNADEQTRRELASQFARLVAANGLPGSGHTDPDHPMLPWLQQYLNDQQWQDLQRVIDSARPLPAAESTSMTEVHHVTEIQLQEPVSDSPATRSQASAASQNPHTPADAGTQTSDHQPDQDSDTSPADDWRWWLLGALLLLTGAGFYRGIRHAKGV